MPNTGMTLGEYAVLARPAPPQGPAAAQAGGLALAGLADKVASQAIKIFVKQVDRLLEQLQGKYAGGATAALGTESDPNVKTQRYEFVRGVRIPLDQLDKIDKLFKPGLSQPVVAYLKQVAQNPDLKIERRQDPLTKDWYIPEEATLQDGWYPSGGSDGGDKIVQFVTTRLILEVETSDDGRGQTVVRVPRPPVLQVFATEALLPDWDRLLKTFQQAAPAQQRALEAQTKAAATDLQRERAGQELESLNAVLISLRDPNAANGTEGWLSKTLNLDRLAREQLSIKMAVTIDFSAPGENGQLVTLGQLSDGVEGVWPTDTRFKDDVLVPAYSARLDGIDPLWFGRFPTKQFNIRVTLSETSRWEKLIAELREQLNEKLRQGKNQGQKPNPLGL